jgi:hypothetical protein
VFFRVSKKPVSEIRGQSSGHVRFLTPGFYSSSRASFRASVVFFTNLNFRFFFASAGVSVVRVHDVAEMVDVVKVSNTINAGIKLVRRESS